MSAIPVCKVDGCDLIVYNRKRGLCKAHYMHDRRMRSICQVEGCDNVVNARNLCSKHYREAGYLKVEKCRVVGCERLALAKGICQAHTAKLRRKRIWTQIIELKGGCCAVCKGVFPYAVYDLHHRNPVLKETAFGLVAVDKMSPAMRAELDSCDLLCANCHRIITFPDINLELQPEGRVEL